MNRTFLGTSQPPLRTAARLLLEQIEDFPNIILVLPGGRPLRRFQELLVEAAGHAIVLPRMITVGELPEQLYAPQRPLAGALERELAWIHALRELPSQQKRQLFPFLLSDPSAGRLRSFARILETLASDVLGSGQRFSDLATRVESEVDVDRWRVIEQLHESFLERLAALDLADRHMERMRALEEEPLFFAGTIHLLCIADMPRITERLLTERYAAAVTSWVAGEEDEAAYFTELGTIAVSRWIDAPPSSEAVRIVVARDYPELAARAIVELSDRGSGTARDQILLCAGDPHLEPYIEGALRAQGIPVHRGEGASLEQDLLVRALGALVPLIRQFRRADLAAVVREPAIEDWLVKAKGIDDTFLMVLDEWEYECLPHVVELGTIQEPQVRTVVAALDELLAPLRGPPRPLVEWIDRLGMLVKTIVRPVPSELSTPSDAERLAMNCLSQWYELCDQDSRWEGGEALTLLLEELREISLPVATPLSAIEFLGWLELPLDDSKVAIIVGCAEGQIPETRDGDSFLPNSVRAAAGLPDDDKRLARDLYVLHTVLRTRQEVRVLVSRMSPQGDPLLVSRILLLGRGEKRTELLRTFYGAEESVVLATERKGAPARQSSFEVVPEPNPALIKAARMESIPVTDFRRYLECPYQYYLERFVRVSTVPPSPQELDPPSWGALVHDVLRRFGESEVRDAADAKLIQQFLEAALDSLVSHRFGRGVVPAVSVQVAALRLRLRSFAEWQAQWRTQGWRIHAVEERYAPGAVTLTLEGGATIGIHGSIDRIDVHESTGRWAIFDYKTGDDPPTPMKAHRKRSGEWIDLQLPAYRLLATQGGMVSPTAAIGLGYIPVSASGGVAEVFADWGADDLASAHQELVRVAGLISRGVFWPPREPLSKRYPLDPFVRVHA